ncbi:MAG: hypothetical protein FWD42_01030 [Solirubrobacterales bacterium]|nr:hypothetical protein [Solirubrobacterales bacterium]
MARVLIVGGGCRGVELARVACAEGHAVRVVTRRGARAGEIERVGAECVVGDPDRLGTLRGALEGVTIACWLLGTARGEECQVRALHGARLRAFLAHTIDTTVRGLAYEAAGTVAPELLAGGWRAVEEASARHAIPARAIRADPAERGRWLADARAQLDSLLSGEWRYPQ